MKVEAWSKLIPSLGGGAGAVSRCGQPVARDSRAGQAEAAEMESKRHDFCLEFRANVDTPARGERRKGYERIQGRI